MPFFIVFGALLILMCVLLHDKIQWETNSTCPQDITDVKINKKAFTATLIVGIVSMMVGIIGVLL